MSHHRIDPRGVETFGDVLPRVSARCPSGRATHYCDADAQTRQSNCQRRALPQQVKKVAACRVFKIAHHCQRQPQTRKGKVAPPPEQPVTRCFKMFDNLHGFVGDNNDGLDLFAGTLVPDARFHGVRGEGSAGLCSASSICPSACWALATASASAIGPWFWLSTGNSSDSPTPHLLSPWSYS